MHILALVLLAAILGAIYSYIAPKLQAAYPASAPSGRIATALLTGAIILVALFLATTVLRIFGMEKRG